MNGTYNAEVNLSTPVIVGNTGFITCCSLSVVHHLRAILELVKHFSCFVAHKSDNNHHLCERHVKCYFVGVGNILKVIASLILYPRRYCKQTTICVPVSSTINNYSIILNGYTDAALFGLAIK